MIPSVHFGDNTYVFDADKLQDGMTKILSDGDGLFVVKNKKRPVAAKQLNPWALGSFCDDPDGKHSLLIYFFGHNSLGLLNLRRTGISACIYSPIFSHHAIPYLVYAILIVSIFSGRPFFFHFIFIIP